MAEMRDLGALAEGRESARSGQLGALFSGSAASRLLGRIAIMTADAVCFVGSLALAAAVVGGGASVGDVVFLAPLLLAVWFAVLSAHNLYSWTPPQRRDVGSLVVALLWCVGLLAVGALLYPESSLLAAEVALAGVLLVGSGLAVHAGYTSGVRAIYRQGLGRIPTVVIGPEEERERVRELLGGGGAYTYAGGLSLGEAPEGERTLVRLRRLLDLTRARNVILTGGAGLEEAQFVEFLRSMWLRRIRVMLVPTTPELLDNTLVVSDDLGTPLLEVRYPRLGSAQRLAKRTLDVLVSGALVVALAPVLAGIAAAVRLESPGGALYRQRRAGTDETPFVCYKFRSMYADADRRQAELEARNEARGAFFKMRRDPRVTRVGRFLRRWSLDELPQLFNVLKGDMSLVGPRPLPLRDYERMSEVEKRRLATVPGITGLWQISGRSDLTFEEMLRLDLHYIENWSLALDLSILLRTFGAILRGKGAY